MPTASSYHACRVHNVRDKVGVAHADGLVERVFNGRVVILHKPVLDETRGKGRLAHAGVPQDSELPLHLNGHGGIDSV